MTDLHRTIIIPASLVADLRDLSAFSEDSGLDGMFLTPLSATGLLPATHYISSGHVPADYADSLTDATKLKAKAQRGYAKRPKAWGYTDKRLADVVAATVVHDGTRKETRDGNEVVVGEDPHALIARMNLKIIRPVV